MEAVLQLEEFYFGLFVESLGPNGAAVLVEQSLPPFFARELEFYKLSCVCLKWPCLPEEHLFFQFLGMFLLIPWHI